MIQQCIFLTGIYLLVLCMLFVFGFFLWFFLICNFYCFVEGKQDTRQRSRLSIGIFTIVYRKLNVVLDHHTNVQSAR